jgi:hypothetical protein
MHKDNVLNVLQQSDQKRARFLEAWNWGHSSLGPAHQKRLGQKNS